MRVTVHLFAGLRDLTGHSEWPCEIAQGSTVQDVWRHLAAAFPGVDRLESSVSCAVNADFASRHTRLADADDVAFLPPVSGG